MYVTAREIIPLPGRLQDTIASGTQLIQEMNQRYGSAMATSTEIGGNPNKLWITGFWPALSDYQSFTESYMSDPELTQKMNMFSSFVSEVQDQIGQVIRQPGERKAFTQMHRGRIKNTHFEEGLELIMKLADHISELSGTEAGLIAPVTGDQYEIIFVNYADSLQELRGMVENWSTDETYQNMFVQGSEYFENSFDVTYARFTG
ncbi:MAG: hypothetical protein CL470_05120 [Acidimicrobiaceae bacterium]|nr:hypothetical protein [Acidimicrobiaceae bacterium]|tara:strand:- start:201 stop:812 length:612 start_codon:yes stop_codon:yes gene_type:complete